MSGYARGQFAMNSCLDTFPGSPAEGRQSPFDRLVAWEFYDGPTGGLVFCSLGLSTVEPAGFSAMGLLSEAKRGVRDARSLIYGHLPGVSQDPSIPSAPAVDLAFLDHRPFWGVLAPGHALLTLQGAPRKKRVGVWFKHFASPLGWTCGAWTERRAGLHPFNKRQAIEWQPEL